MNPSKFEQITVSAEINAPIEKVWKYWTEPEHISKWCFASSDWHAPKAENDLRYGGKFLTRMEAIDQSFGFDFEGEYTQVNHHEIIAYKMADERRVEIKFSSDGNGTSVVETFDAETENPLDMQKTGWQAILDNFKKYVEEN